MAKSGNQAWGRFAALAAAAFVAAVLSGCATTDQGNPDEEAYRAARRALEESRNADALDDYASVRTDSGVYAESALLDSGYAALRRNEPVAAKAIADRYIGMYPQSEKLPYAIVLQVTAHYAVLRDAQKPTAAEIDATIADLTHVKEAYPKVAPPEVIDEMIAELKARRKA